MPNEVASVSCKWSKRNPFQYGQKVLRLLIEKSNCQKNNHRFIRFYTKWNGSRWNDRALEQLRRIHRNAWRILRPNLQRIFPKGIEFVKKDFFKKLEDRETAKPSGRRLRRNWLKHYEWMFDFDLLFKGSCDKRGSGSLRIIEQGQNICFRQGNRKRKNTRLVLGISRYESNNNICLWSEGNRGQITSK